MKHSPSSCSARYQLCSSSGWKWKLELEISDLTRLASDWPRRTSDFKELHGKMRILNLNTFHTMSSGYTCFRCLVGQAPSITGCRSLQRATKAKRWITSSSKPTPGLAGRASPAVGTAQRKAAAIRFQSQYAKSEPVEPQTRPGLAYSPPSKVESQPLVQSNNLFHPFSTSPSPDIRRRAAYIKQHAYCPHPNHRQTRLPENPDISRAPGISPPAHVNFECPDCGIPVYCSEEHWADDYESHLEICDTLRQINEDDHDLRSGRFFREFEYPGPQMPEILVNMTNWDTCLYTRQFEAINEDRSMRHATKLLTYPITLGSILHELSPYNIRSGGRLTVEGLKSLSGTSHGPISYCTQLTHQQPSAT